jgi:hypothetical protein
VYTLYRVSDDALIKNDAENYTSNTTYTKLKEIYLSKVVDGQISNWLRVYFELRSTSSSYLARGRVYCNGAAVGTERSTTSTTYVAFTEDISLTVADGDLIQLYGRIATSAYYCYVQNFRINGTYVLVTKQIQSSNTL